MRISSHLLALLVIPLAVACIPEEDGAPDDVAVLETSSAMASSFDLMNVSGGFAASEALGILPVRLARVRALQDAVQAMVALVRDPACVTVDTDEESFVEVRFNACPAGLLRQREIDGSLRADLDFETAPCGLDECPVAALYTLSTPRLRMGVRLGVRFVEIAGSWALRAPVATDEPTTWTAEIMMTNHLDRRLAMSSRASWLVEGACTTTSLDAELTVDGRDDVGTIATSARALTRCADACPASGTVQIAYGLGNILAWSYTGSNTVTVTGPRGRSFEMALNCDA